MCAVAALSFRFPHHHFFARLFGEDEKQSETKTFWPSLVKERSGCDGLYKLVLAPETAALTSKTWPSAATSSFSSLQDCTELQNPIWSEHAGIFSSFFRLDNYTDSRIFIWNQLE
jgi:hypothetical protein